MAQAGHALGLPVWFTCFGESKRELSEHCELQSTTFDGQHTYAVVRLAMRYTCYTAPKLRCNR